MTRSVLLAAFAFVTLSAGSIYAKPMRPFLTSMGSPQHAHMFINPSKSKTLYDQNKDDAGYAILSDTFDSGSFEQYDTQGADDFTVPDGSNWKVSEVDVTGVYFNGYGPADGVDVYFYKSKKGMPKGAPIAEFKDANYTDSGNGSFAITLYKPGSLKAGTYFVSVVAEMNFSGGAGEWGWEVSSVQNGDQAVWQNPGAAFGICPTWETLESCLEAGPDLMFALKGKAS